jgi:hypothetical protein
MKKKLFALQVTVVLLLVAVLVTTASAATSPGSLTFSNTTLARPNGDSEPAISIGSDGTMAITGLPWIRNSFADFATDLWTGPFGSTPVFQGGMDAGLIQPGRTVVGALDADIDIGSTGRLHGTSLLGFVNKPFTGVTLGVSAITCPSPASAGFSVSQCTEQIIDKAGSDRQWITSDGRRVWISYHDSGASSLIHVQRSDDDGYTWKKVASPIVGQDGITANSTFNNIQGPIVADPFTHNVYDIYAAGETGFLKGRTFTPNHIYVSRSTDGGKSWTASLVYQIAPGLSFVNIFPALAVDPTNGRLYAAFSDGHQLYFSASSDQGVHWSPAVVVNTSPANAAIFPWVAAYNGTVDVVYYATDGDGPDDTSATWNVYMAQTVNDGASFTQSLVSNSPNHMGQICTEGTACGPGTRNLLDLFEVSINPQNGRAAIIYTDDIQATDPDGNPLPQIVLAQQQ